MPRRFVVLMLLLAAPLGAQYRAAPTQTFGVLGGLASGKLVVSGEGGDFTFGARNAPALGFSMHRTGGASPLGIELDLLYLQKGFRTEVDGATAELKLAYLELPILLRYSIGSGPYLLGGGSVAVRLSCSGAFGDGEGGTVGGNCQPGSAKTFDYGLMVGAGITRDRLSLTARYGLGLAGILDDEADVTTKTRTLLVLVGVRL